MPTTPDSEKKANRDSVLTGHPYSVQDRQITLNYCREDVEDTARICKALLPGQAAYESEVYDRGYTISLSIGNHAEKPTEKPAEKKGE